MMEGISLQPTHFFATDTFAKHAPQKILNWLMLRDWDSVYQFIEFFYPSIKQLHEEWVKRFIDQHHLQKLTRKCQQTYNSIFNSMTKEQRSIYKQLNSLDCFSEEKRVRLSIIKEKSGINLLDLYNLLEGHTLYNELDEGSLMPLRKAVHGLSEYLSTKDECAAEMKLIAREKELTQWNPVLDIEIARVGKYCRPWNKMTLVQQREMLNEFIVWYFVDTTRPFSRHLANSWVDQLNDSSNIILLSRCWSKDAGLIVLPQPLIETAPAPDLSQALQYLQQWTNQSSRKKKNKCKVDKTPDASYETTGQIQNQLFLTCPIQPVLTHLLFLFESDYQNTNDLFSKVFAIVPSGPFLFQDGKKNRAFLSKIYHSEKK